MEGKVVWSVADAIINNQQVDYPPPLVARNTDYSVNTSTWEYGDEYYIQDGLFYIKIPLLKHIIYLISLKLQKCLIIMLFAQK